MKFEGSIEFSIVERSDNRVISEMPIRAGIKNPFGVAHVGAILWFADVTATVLIMGSEQPSEGMKGFPLAITLNALWGIPRILSPRNSVLPGLLHLPRSSTGSGHRPASA